MDLDKKIDEHLSGNKRVAKERTYFHVSELGKSKKEIYRSMKGLSSEDIDPRVQRIFDNGNSMHSRYYKYLLEMGILVAAEMTCVEDDLFHGRADAVITDKKDLWILDLKSCSQWVFQKLTDAQVDHKIQLQAYMYFMNIPRGIILYENKDNQAVKIFKFELDRPLFEKYIEEFRKLREDIISGKVPDDVPIIVAEVQYG